jgi:hypothetical protein
MPSLITPVTGKYFAPTEFVAQAGGRSPADGRRISFDIRQLSAGLSGKTLF